VTADSLRVEPATPADRDEIDAFVLASPRATLWHRPAWMRAVGEVFGTPDLTLVARRGGRIVGCLPLGRSRTITLGSTLVSVPYGVYGGVAGEDSVVEKALLERAREVAVRESVDYLELRHRDPRVGGLAESDLYVTFERELPSKPEEVLGSLPRKARAAARQARDRHGLTFDEGLWHLDDLYHLFSINKRHLGSPPLPHAFFEALRNAFRGSVYLHLVRLQKEPIAAVLSFAFRDTLLPYYSGGRDDLEHTQCNNFLYWKLMEWAVERGFRRFDFGRSRRDSGPFHFKRNQGFEPTPLHYGYHLVRGRRLPSVNPSNPIFDFPRRIWQRLPLALHQALGARLSRYLP
jgi:FemAB-related protein (PEP-CTERM system-associated)